MSQTSPRKLTAFLAALCLFLSAIEYAIPKPLPFLRIGLANLPIILALTLLSKKEYFSLVFFKVISQAIISGTLFSYVFLFSIAGSFSSAFFMFLLYKLFKSKNWISSIGISLIGSLANNSAQLFLSFFILFGKNTRFIAPIMLIFALISGLLLGFFINVFQEKSLWYKERLKEKMETSK